jgi:hypothetical protein
MTFGLFLGALCGGDARGITKTPAGDTPLISHCPFRRGKQRRLSPSSLRFSLRIRVVMLSNVSQGLKYALFRDLYYNVARPGIYLRGKLLLSLNNSNKRQDFDRALLLLQVSDARTPRCHLKVVWNC